MSRLGVVSTTEKIAAKRRADAERQRRSRAARRESGLPSQALIDGALVEALAWAAARSMARPLKARDLASGGLSIDVALVVSRAVQRLIRQDPHRGGALEDVAFAKAVAARVFDRVASHRDWWVGSWSISPRSRPLITSPPPAGCADLMLQEPPSDGSCMDADGEYMDGFEWPDDLEFGDQNDDIGPETAMNAPCSAIDGHEHDV